MAFRTDLPFAMVPMWVLELDLSDKAIRLYAVLAGMADYSSGETVVKRKTLAAKISASVDTVDRAKQDLIDAGAISMEHRVNGDASQGANVYVVHRIPPDVRTNADKFVTLNQPEGFSKFEEKYGEWAGRADAAGGGMDAGGEGRTDAAPMNEIHSSQRSSSPKRQGRAPTQIGGKRVSAVEEQFALAVLTEFNEVSGRRFASKEALGKIILRHREHPDLDVAAHRSIIEAQFEKPWWKGDPSPSVIYGSGEVFDRALNGVRGGDDHSKDEQDDPYARGAERAGDGDGGD